MSGIVKLILIFTSCVFLHLAKSHAQQTPLYTQYFLNPYLYNPAMAGATKHPNAFFLYRRQWAGIDGAPESQVFTLDSKLSRQPVGLGLTFYNDITNIIGRTGGAFTGSYRVQLTTDHTLRFGLTFSATRNRIFFDRIHTEDISDPGLLNAVDQRTAFESNAGLAYSYKGLNIGFSAEQLFQNNLRYRNEAMFQTLNYTLVRHYYSNLYYELKASENISLQPMLMIRTVQGLRSQLDLNMLVKYREIVWANLNYRRGIGAGVAVGWALDDQFVFGYSYDFPTSDLNILGNATHEFALGLRMKKASGGSSPRKKTAAGDVGFSAAQYEKLDAIKQQNDLIQARQEKLQSQLDIQNEELRLLREIVAGYESELAATILNLQATAADTSMVGSGKFYLVVGALRTIENAKLLQKILKREAALDSRVVQSRSGTWFFVYTQEFDSVEGGLKQVQVLLKSKARPYIIGNPWLYNSEKQ